MPGEPVLAAGCEGVDAAIGGCDQFDGCVGFDARLIVALFAARLYSGGLTTVDDPHDAEDGGAVAVVPWYLYPPGGPYGLVAGGVVPLGGDVGEVDAGVPLGAPGCVVCVGGSHCCCDDGDADSGAAVADDGGAVNIGGVVGVTPVVGPTGARP